MNVNKIYTFWNNKGGTGKSTLAFQTVCRYAEVHPDEKILVIDMCPQANLTELMLGGLVGNGGQNLTSLQQLMPRRSVGGYFESRLPTPYNCPQIQYNEFISSPRQFNSYIPNNIDLLAGDPIVELQANAMATLANTQIPGIDTWQCVIQWLINFIDSTDNYYQKIFIDTNPSFSIYTQIAIAAADRLILPVMADDSSRRAILNVFSLVYGLNLPSGMAYSNQVFAAKLGTIREIPKIHLIVKNRLTQYMGTASAYSSVLSSIDDIVRSILLGHPEYFTFSNLNAGIVSVKDFQTTGVISLANGTPFSQISAGKYEILGQSTNIRADYLEACRSEINRVVQCIN